MDKVMIVTGGGQLSEVASAILRLLSEEVSYTTSTFIELAGAK